LVRDGITRIVNNLDDGRLPHDFPSLENHEKRKPFSAISANSAR
jgi:hypothetical protein